MDRERAAGQERIDIWRTETEQSRAPIFFLFRVTLVDRGPLQKPCSDHRHPPPPQKCSTKTPPKQIAPCPRREVHDWAVCPYAHAGEKARRRDPVGSCSGDPSLAVAPCEQLYTGIACPSMKSVSRLCAFVSIRIAAVKASRFSRMKIGARERESERTRERAHARAGFFFSIALTSPFFFSLFLLSQTGSCHRGDRCPYAHNVFEYWLHPTR